MGHYTASAAPLPVPGDSPSRHPLDMLHLSRQTMGDPGLQGEVLRMFADGLRTYLGRLEASSTRNDAMVNLHALKGSAAGVGAFSLAQLARTAEDELRSGAPLNRERVADIAMAVEEVDAFIAPLIADETL